MRIEDTEQPLPPSRREGLHIPQEFREAVEDSLQSGKTKKVAVDGHEELRVVLAYIRSLYNREGYRIRKKEEKDTRGQPVALKFRTESHGQPPRKNAQT